MPCRISCCQQAIYVPLLDIFLIILSISTFVAAVRNETRKASTLWSGLGCAVGAFNILWALFSVLFEPSKISSKRRWDRWNHRSSSILLVLSVGAVAVAATGTSQTSPLIDKYCCGVDVAVAIIDYVNFMRLSETAYRDSEIHEELYFQHKFPKHWETLKEFIRNVTSIVLECMVDCLEAFWNYVCRLARKTKRSMRACCAAFHFILFVLFVAVVFSWLLLNGLDEPEPKLGQHCATGRSRPA